VVSNNGTTAQVITPPSVTPEFPEFSPDGSKIYFVNIGGEGWYETWSINPDGTGATNLGQLDYCTHQVTVAPNGKLYSYGHSAGVYGIYSMNADGTNPTLVINDDSAEHPAVNADGSKLIYQHSADGYDIYSANIDGSNPVALTTGGNNEDPLVSGDKVLFVSTRDGNPEIYSMDLSGTNQTRLTNNSVADIFGEMYTPW
jgi:Tol biopolymer transport system component